VQALAALVDGLAAKGKAGLVRLPNRLATASPPASDARVPYHLMLVPPGGPPRLLNCNHLFFNSSVIRSTFQGTVLNPF
jgi:hypothetical protein